MEIPRHWRSKAQRYRLEGALCPICGRPTFPPRPICCRCQFQQGGAAEVMMVLSQASDINDTLRSLSSRQPADARIG